MATKIRLKRLGKIRTPHYRVIVIDSREKRDGRAIEEIGQYHPKNDPSVIKIDSERVQYWLGVGAQPTEAVRKLLELTGDWQKFTGDDSIPAGVDLAADKPSKLDLFNAALAEGDGEASKDAFAKSKKTDQAEAEKAKPKEEAKPAEETEPAEKAEEPKAEEAAEEPKAEEAAEEKPAEEEAEEKPAEEEAPAAEAKEEASADDESADKA